MTDTTDADESADEIVVRYNGAVDLAAEQRDGMYEALCDEFGADAIDQQIQQAVDEQARQVVVQAVTRLFDNRDSLREQMEG